jgi:DNA-binding MarR family transcriptional regulator
MRGQTKPDRELSLAWGRMSALFSARRDELFLLLQKDGLTPPHGFALSVLAYGPVRMRDLADQMVCDASYITSVVDRLELAGLAERLADPNDRRVKTIALTLKGKRVSAELRACMASIPAELEQLSAVERAQLIKIMAKLAPDVLDPVDPFRPHAHPNP